MRFLFVDHQTKFSKMMGFSSVHVFIFSDYWRWSPKNSGSLSIPLLKEESSIRGWILIMFVLSGGKKENGFCGFVHLSHLPNFDLSGWLFLLNTLFFSVGCSLLGGMWWWGSHSSFQVTDALIISVPYGPYIPSLKQNMESAFGASLLNVNCSLEKLKK